MEETEEKREDRSKAPTSPETPRKNSPASSPPISGTSKAFAFWGYFTVAVSLVTLLFISLPRIEQTEERSWFLSLPDALLRHYSSGKLIKVNAPSNSAVIHVFAVDLGPRDADVVLLVHGLGCSSYSFRSIAQSLAAAGIRAVAVDLPGAGFSDEINLGNIAEWRHSLGWIWNIYAEIKEKGIFSGFDQLIETGEIHERPARVFASKESGYGTMEMSQILGQVIDSMDLAPVHLVLHDSALCVALHWVSANPGLVSSLTLMDASPRSSAFPTPLLRLPVFGHLLLRSKHLFARLLRLCCARSVHVLDAEAYRMLLKRRNGGREAVAAGKALNHSLDIGEWANSEVLEGLPVQMLWSNSLSDRWIDEGRRIRAEIPRAKFAFHSGGRWGQEDAAEEISELIANFVLSLPKSNSQMKADPDPEHIQKMFDEASHHVHNHHHHHHHHGHEEDSGPNFMGIYQGDEL